MQEEQQKEKQLQQQEQREEQQEEQEQQQEEQKQQQEEQKQQQQQEEEEQQAHAPFQTPYMQLSCAMVSVQYPPRRDVPSMSITTPMDAILPLGQPYASQMLTVQLGTLPLQLYMVWRSSAAGRVAVAHQMQL